MISIKRLLYSLKRRFGKPMDFYREGDGEPNPETGVIVQTRIKYHLEEGIFLDQRKIIRSPLTKVLNQLVGVMKTADVIILVDGDDFCVNFIPLLTDYIIIEHKRYEIQNIRDVDRDQSYQINLVEYKGSEKFEQFDL